ncbi:MAG: hypothetical protein ACREBS_11265 [Nitrososphaerales archaeon]
MQIHVIYASGDTIKDFTNTTDSNGVAAATWLIGGDSDTGLFSVTASLSVNQQTVTSGFEVIAATSTTTSSSSTSTTSSSSSSTTSTATTTTSSTSTSQSSTSSSSSSGDPSLVTMIPVALTGEFAYDQNNRIIYATAENSIVEINAVTNQVMGTIRLSETPTGIVFDNLDQELYIAANYVIGGATQGGLTAIKVTGAGYQMMYNVTGFPVVGDLALNSRTGYIYLVDVYTSHSNTFQTVTENLAVINTVANENLIVKNVTVSSSSPSLIPGPIVFDSSNGYIYGVARSVGIDGGGGSTYFVINTNNGYSSVSGPYNFPPNFPVSFAYNSGSGLVYIAPTTFEIVMGISSYSLPGQNLTVVDGTSVSRTIQLSSSSSSNLTSTVYDQLNDEIYVGNSSSSGYTLTPINAANYQIGSVTNLPSFAKSMFVNPENNYLYVVMSNEVYVFSTS